MGRLHQQGAQVAVADFGDALLRIAIAGLVLLGTQAQPGAHLAAVRHRIGPVQGEHVGGRHHRAHAGRGAQQGNFRIALGERFDLLIQSGDVRVERGYLFEQSSSQRGEAGRDVLGGSLGERFAGTVGKPPAGAFGQAAQRIDDQGAGAHQGVPGAQPIQILLARPAAMLNGFQQFWVGVRQAGQLLGIVAIVFRHAVRDGVDLARVGHDDLVPPLLEPSADPRRMRAAFQGDALARDVGKLLPQPFFRGGNATFFDHFALRVEDAVMAETIPEIQTYGPFRLLSPLGVLPVTIVHRLVSFLRFECAADRILMRFRETSRLIHLKPDDITKSASRRSE